MTEAEETVDVRVDNEIASLETLDFSELVAILLGMITYIGDGKVSKKEQNCIAKMMSLPILKDAKIFHRDKMTRK